MTARQTRRALRLAVGALSLSVLVTVPVSAAVAAEPAPVLLRLITFNDFHGALGMEPGNDPKTSVDESADWSNVAEFATAIEIARAEVPQGSSALLSAGDSIGSSPFASAVVEDAPTVEILNALHVDAMAIGNHELDRGYPSLKSRLIDGSVPGYPRANFPVLGANVLHLDGSAALQPYAVLNVSGARTCVVGAVTAETAKTIPLPIGDIQITEPVSAVNKVVAELEAADACDVTVALMHEGGNLWGEASIAEQMAAQPTFKRMIQLLDSRVDALVNGHRHRNYAYLVPRDGAVPLPVVQARDYGRAIGVIDLSFDPTTGEVTGATAQWRPSTVGANLTYPRVAAARQIEERARDEANEIGKRRVVSAAGPVTRAWRDGSYVDGRRVGGSVADITAESTGGHLLTDALRDAPAGVPLSKPDLGLLPESSVRSDWLTGGEFNYLAAYSLFPDENQVAHVSLTGEQLHGVLEQQWPSTGVQASRLALSSNAQVRTNPNASAGQRIRAVYLDGVLVQPTQTYVIATDNYLARGWGGFTRMREGTAHFPGVSARRLFIDSYLESLDEVVPDYRARQVETDLPVIAAAGESISATLAGVDLGSTGSPKNVRVNTYLSTATGNTRIDTAPMVHGLAKIQAVAPSAGNVVAVAQPSGTVVGTALSKWSTRIVQRTKREYARDKSVRVRIRSELPASGSMRLKAPSSKRWRRAAVTDGVAEFRLPTRRYTPGRYRFRVKYSGDASHEPTRGQVRLVVQKFKPEIRLVNRSKAGRRQLFVVIDTDRLVTPTGSLHLRWGSRRATVPLRQGRALLPVSARELRNVRGVRVVYPGRSFIARVKATLRASDL